MKITVEAKYPEFETSVCHVLIDGRHVGTGSRKECEALADELRDDETGDKARMLYAATPEED